MHQETDNETKKFATSTVYLQLPAILQVQLYNAARLKAIDLVFQSAIPAQKVDHSMTSTLGLLQAQLARMLGAWVEDEGKNYRSGEMVLRPAQDVSSAVAEEEASDQFKDSEGVGHRLEMSESPQGARNVTITDVI
ncbi:hypothetical protein Moror_16494 [Moniliophthora roreri MCA 2997]|uniref:Uncharacterized protein n=1 Tax=Moniliophthora roreri (strain MCA 2997) TaxID=1381753 RepID=V2XDE6_MONRO|nr:hypothetical protein Moror_16494 [Moniliophthora roreri MCA 2997]